MSQLLSQRWLLLLHQIPPSPAYFRAKILRKLNQLGALSIKNSAYVLPETNEINEDLEWVRSEILHEGGEAWLFRMETLGHPADEDLREAFRNLRAADYKQLLDSMNQLTEPDYESDAAEISFRKLKRKFDDIRRIDFFDAPGRKEVENAMDHIAGTLHVASARPAVKPEPQNLTGRTWVTRRGVKVDRIASAWLIRRFIDSSARFAFVDPDRHAPKAHEIRFDMFEGEFSHEGGLCTFEVLLRHCGLHDPALDSLSQAVHDIDLKEDKYQRVETGGIAAMIDGIAALHADDEQRIAEGSRLFDAMYAALQGGKEA